MAPKKSSPQMKKSSPKKASPVKRMSSVKKASPVKRVSAVAKKASGKAKEQLKRVSQVLKKNKKAVTAGLTGVAVLAGLEKAYREKAPLVDGKREMSRTAYGKTVAGYAKGQAMSLGKSASAKVQGAGKSVSDRVSGTLASLRAFLARKREEQSK